MRATPVITRFIRFCKFSGCFAGLALAANAIAQQAAETPQIPTGKLLLPPPEYSQWGVTYSYPQDRFKDEPLPALEKSLPRRVTTTKTCDILHEETVDVAGVKSDKWQAGTTFYLKPPGQNYWGEYDRAWYHNNLPTSAALQPVPLKGFQDLDWIGRDTYAGSIKQNGAEYFVFVPSNAGSLDVGNPAALHAQPVIAYVDAATRLPVRFKNGDVIRSYAFAPEAPPPLALPADLVREIRDGKERRAKVFVAPKREY